MGVNSSPKTVTRQRRDCDLNLGPSAPESSTLKINILFKENMLKKFYQTALGNCYGLKLQKCWLLLLLLLLLLIAVKNKFIVSFIIIFGTISFRQTR